jgi:hypothetical protein
MSKERKDSRPRRSTESPERSSVEPPTIDQPVASPPETGLPESSPTGSRQEDGRPYLTHAERAPEYPVPESVLERILDKMDSLSNDFYRVSSDICTISERLEHVEKRDLDRPPTGQRMRFEDLPAPSPERPSGRTSGRPHHDHTSPVVSDSERSSELGRRRLRNREPPQTHLEREEELHQDEFMASQFMASLVDRFVEKKKKSPSRDNKSKKPDSKTRRRTGMDPPSDSPSDPSSSSESEDSSRSHRGTRRSSLYYRNRSGKKKKSKVPDEGLGPAIHRGVLRTALTEDSSMIKLTRCSVSAWFRFVREVELYEA